MEPGTVVAIVVIAIGGVLLAAVAATETALERANGVRIQALAARGDERAQRIAGSVERPAPFLAPMTVARVLLAATVVTAFAYIGATRSGASAAVWMGLIGGLVVAVVELTVGLVVARQPEYSALQFSRVARITGRAFWAPAFVLGLPSRIVARSIRAVTPDPDVDILSLVEREEAAGGVEEQGRRMIRGVIELEDKTVREIMVPRIDIVAVDIGDAISDVIAIVNEKGVSRVPVYRENIDDVVGIVYAKDLLRSSTNGNTERRLDALIRQPTFIPESKRLDNLLAEMRATRTHLAIVVDEYGGTAGLVTIEDLLEEIVGEIEDEYDVSRPTLDVVSEDEVVVDASMGTDSLKELFGYEVESEDFDTIGGFLIHELGRLPSVGDEVVVDDLRLRVVSMAGRRIRRLRITRSRTEAEAVSGRS